MSGSLTRRSALTVVAAVPVAAAAATVIPAVLAKAVESQEEVAPIFPFPAGVIRILPDEELLEGSIVAFRILDLDQRALISAYGRGLLGAVTMGDLFPRAVRTSTTAWAGLSTVSAIWTRGS